MNRILPMVSIAAAVFSVQAANVTFPTKDGDLASASDWGGQLPAITDNILLSNGVYRLSSDLTVGSVSVNKQFVTFDFSEDGKTLKLTKPVEYNIQNSIFHYPYNVDNAVTTLNGGVWDCSGQRLNIVALGGAATQHYTVVVTNGCVVTNILASGEDSVFAKRIGMTLRIVDKARFYAGQTRLIDNSGSMLVDVTQGGLLAFNGSCFTDKETTSAGSTIDCHGEGSALLFNSGLYLGYNSRGNEVCVRDGATLTAGAVSINYNSNATNNWLRVLDQATATVDKVVCRHAAAGIQVSNAVMTVGNDVQMIVDGKSLAHACRVESLDGACLWVKGGLYSAQPDNHILVRNGTLKIDGTSTCIGGWSASCNCSFTISGPQAKVEQNAGLQLMGAAGTNNFLQIENGATFRPPSGLVVVQGKGSVCRVTGSGTVLDGRTATGGSRTLMVVAEPASGTVTPSTNNVFEVSDGALVKADRLFVQGANTSVIVSNATISACSEESGGTSGYAIWIGRGGGGSCNLVMRGTTPAIRCPKLGTGERAMIVQGPSKIRYEVPAEGYAADFAPIEVDALNMASTTATLEIECGDWASVKGFGKTELVLFRLTGEDFTTTARNWFNQQTLNLPTNVTCFIRGREIVLCRKSTLGMTVIIR